MHAAVYSMMNLSDSADTSPRRRGYLDTRVVRVVRFDLRTTAGLPLGAKAGEVRAVFFCHTTQFGNFGVEAL